MYAAPGHANSSSARRKRRLTKPRPKRKLPTFNSDFTTDDAVLIKVSVIGARIVMKEVPLFGKRDGSLNFEPWPDDSLQSWKHGLGAQGFEGMCCLAVAATLAFYKSVWGVRVKEDTDLDIFSPRVSGSDLVKTEEFKEVLPAVLFTALTAIKEIVERHNRDIDSTEHVANDFYNFCCLLAVYLAKDNESIGVVHAEIERVVDDNM